MRGLLLALLLTGCTHVSASALDERTMILSGRGSAYSTQAQVTRDILVRAATEAQARGFTHFAILGAEDASSTGTFTTPTTTNVTGSASCMGSFCSGQATGTTYGGQTFAFDRPGEDVTIRFLRADEVPPGAKGVWEAASVLAAQTRRR